MSSRLAILLACLSTVIPPGLAAREVRIEQRLPREWGADYPRDPGQALGVGGLEIEGGGTLEPVERDGRRGFEITGDRPAHLWCEPTGAGAIVRVTRPDGGLIGTVELRERAPAHLIARARYVIRDRDGVVLARSTELVGRRSGFEIVEAGGAVHRVRAVADWRCYWTVTFAPEGGLDPRLVWTAVAMQADDWPTSS